MKIIDCHLHVNNLADVNTELHILDNNIEKLLKELSLQLKKNQIEKGLVILLDTRLAVRPESLLILKGFSGGNLAFSIMPDFRDKQTLQPLKATLKNGSICGIKFHPIHQKILPPDYENIKNFFLSLNNEEIILTIDTAYLGYCDAYSGLGLARFMLPFVKNPVVFAHSGGLRILEAMNIALEYKNVYLETSFSIPYYLGSSIEEDIAFAMRKIGAKRFLYGSDAPFIELGLAKKSLEQFLIKHRFNLEERKDIFYYTAYKLLNKKE